MKVKDILGEHSPLSEDWVVEVINTQSETLYWIDQDSLLEEVPLAELGKSKILSIEPSLVNKGWMTIVVDYNK